MKIKNIGETKLIERFRKRIRLDKSVVKGSGDDAAVIRWRKDKLLLFTCDMLIENVHFRKTASPRRIGHKALAVNISDIAAMGGVPKHAVVSLGLPQRTNLNFVDSLFSGMKTLADRFGVNIVGGDVDKSDKLIINIALLGEAGKSEFVTRQGARSGDIIMVTGRLGGAAFGRHLKFSPRLKEARFLVKNFKINSMIDVSDGLASDLSQICRASRVGAVIYESLIPVSRQARSVKNALSDGEDFELLFTLPKRYATAIVKSFKKNNLCSVTPIGEITSRNKAINIIDKAGRTKHLRHTGFTHF